MIDFNNLPCKDKIYFKDDYTVIYCADCKDILPHFEDKSFDLVLTDPPYGINRDKGFGGSGGFNGAGQSIPRRQYKDTWDNERPSKELFSRLILLSNNSLIFGGNFFADILPVGNHWLVWDKLNTMPTFGDCELIWTNIKRNSVKKYIVEYNGLIGKEENRQHPTQKPIKLIAKLVADYSKEHDLILDPFLGSGTTTYCANKLNRKSIGIEISEKYCEIARNRLAQQVMKI